MKSGCCYPIHMTLCQVSKKQTITKGKSEEVGGNNTMAMTCITGGKECTGCMACVYSDYIVDYDAQCEGDEDGE